MRLFSYITCLKIYGSNIVKFKVHFKHGDTELDIELSNDTGSGVNVDTTMNEK